mmetsp:Transcript_12666/g.30919  ORF Transcript_12666/g.30919 Transcript_12666/m.30919 type:complete len:208 (-) Transcript_12666:142-765(-)|eukprot:CAMPEP_0181110548 /NCGR_PEP_ID=MMETSP1071-20121207/18778_1 /TAXON_ID=35127 /ORGANISM="Thalassiosira sp., Strain NH16" /LENGTH=207 /DNA_ID=CAMNT_0023194337 /DNA_START=8 /DNA_END=631 /DNA_ORIENTATION=-
MLDAAAMIDPTEKSNSSQRIFDAPDEITIDSQTQPGSLDDSIIAAEMTDARISYVEVAPKSLAEMSSDEQPDLEAGGRLQERIEKGGSRLQADDAVGKMVKKKSVTFETSDDPEEDSDPEGGRRRASSEDRRRGLKRSTRGSIRKIQQSLTEQRYRRQGSITEFVVELASPKDYSEDLVHRLKGVGCWLGFAVVLAGFLYLLLKQNH